ncbi:hypothetical protein B0H15DRAFT_439724 [Mycena belliarum]|uniref:Uncharacterized protein n=1 Tax=Mycena belliarum TaxID=1033014 RepID=A0AAD6TYV2_9AGAR|nr:hypothetical protein B0H15DRAFT_439724 [Mycena belliae]
MIYHAASVRIYWVDFVNVRRCRIVPVEHFKALLEANPAGVSSPKIALGLIHLTIDITTLRHCPVTPGHLVVLGQFELSSFPPRRPGQLTSFQEGAGGITGAERGRSPFC